MRKFKVGDVVKPNKKADENYTITTTSVVREAIVTELRDYTMDIKIIKGSCSVGKVFTVEEKYFDLVRKAKQETIVIYRNDNKVVALDKTTGKKAEAKCNPADEFDFRTGAKLAFNRLMGEDVKHNGLIPHFYPGEIKGDLLMDGHSLLEMKPSELAGQVGTVFQDPRSQFFMTDTTRELAFGCENLGLAREETIDRIARAAKELELVEYLNRSIFALSSGEKQQIAIGSVYALAPKVYIFDEPSANLDYAATKRLAEIMKKLKSAGYTIFVVEHRFYYLRDLIDRVFLIQEGKVEREFSREQFCSLSDEIRISYGLRTAYPERDAEHYQGKQRPHNGTHLMEVHDLGFSYK